MKQTYLCHMKKVFPMANTKMAAYIMKLLETSELASGLINLIINDNSNNKYQEPMKKVWGRSAKHPRF